MKFLAISLPRHLSPARKRPQPFDGPGQVKQSGSKVQFGPSRSARHRAERFLSGVVAVWETCQIVPKSCSSLQSVITNW